MCVCANPELDAGVLDAPDRACRFPVDTVKQRGYSNNMTTRQTAKLNILRSEAEAHDDYATVALVDAAIAGDATAAAKLGVAAKALRAVSTGAAAKAPRGRRLNHVTRNDHPFAHDEE